MKSGNRNREFPVRICTSGSNMCWSLLKNHTASQARVESSYEKKNTHAFGV